MGNPSQVSSTGLITLLQSSNLIFPTSSIVVLELAFFYRTVYAPASGIEGEGYLSEKTVSTEEQQILDELEADIEDDLEREIIDSMCRLARHLQRLYRHKDTRELTSSASDYQFALSHTENMFVSELNIKIKLDGQCKIDITKVEKDAAAIQPEPCPSTSQSNKRQGSLETRHDDTVYCRKQQNHPVVPWR